MYVYNHYGRWCTSLLLPQKTALSLLLTCLCTTLCCCGCYPLDNVMVCNPPTEQQYTLWWYDTLEWVPSLKHMHTFVLQYSKILFSSLSFTDTHMYIQLLYTMVIIFSSLSLKLKCCNILWILFVIHPVHVKLQIV